MTTRTSTLTTTMATTLAKPKVRPDSRRPTPARPKLTPTFPLANTTGRARPRGKPQGEAEERKQALRGQLIYLVRAEFAADSSYLSKPLSALNREAASRQKSGEDMAAIASYAKLFAKVQKKRLTHPELYVTHCNRSVRNTPSHPPPSLSTSNDYWDHQSTS